MRILALLVLIPWVAFGQQETVSNPELDTSRCQRISQSKAPRLQGSYLDTSGVGERWHLEGDTLRAEGFFIWQGDTSTFESIRLFRRHDRWVYKVRTPEIDTLTKQEVFRTVEFVGGRVGRRDWLFINESNDFPSHISYSIRKKRLDIGLRGRERNALVGSRLVMNRQD